MSDVPGNVENVRNLLNHPAFDLRNPNKVCNHQYLFMFVCVRTFMRQFRSFDWNWTLCVICRYTHSLEDSAAHAWISMQRTGQATSSWGRLSCNWTKLILRFVSILHLTMHMGLIICSCLFNNLCGFQVASRMVSAFSRWKRYDETRQNLAKVSSWCHFFCGIAIQKHWCCIHQIYLWDLLLAGMLICIQIGTV